MAKIIKKINIGIKEVVQIEVKTTPSDELSNSYIVNNTIHKNCNGPHVPLVVVDEIDTVSGEGLRAFADIAGMLDSRGRQKALRIGISTRKSRYGLMNRQIEEAERAGRTVKKWTALEFAERCPDIKSGTVPTDLYVPQDDMEVLTVEEWSNKAKSKQAEYELETFPGEKCRTCPIAACCRGDAKKQISVSPMLKPITDPIKKAMENGSEWAISQLFNLKPSIEGIIYKEFDEKLHTKDWSEMWKILTGKDYPGECTHDIFVKKCHQMKLSCYAGMDFGWSNPSTIVYFFVDNRENIYVVRTEGMTYISNPSWMEMIKNKWHHMYRCQLYFPDLANPGDGVEMRKQGLPCSSTVDKSVESGIQTVKKWLKSLGSPMPKIFFAKETCTHIITEFGMYHYKTDAAGKITDSPEKEFDHWLDALRYAVYELFGKNSMMIGSEVDTSTESPMTTDGKFTRTPSAAEYAGAMGLRFNENSPKEAVNLGKIGKICELDEDEAEDEMGFLWTF